MDALQGFIRDALKRYPIGQAFLLSFLIALAAVLVAGVIFGFVIPSDSAWKITFNTAAAPALRAVLLLVFSIVWIVSFLVIFFLSRDQRDDYYSALRAALVGTWSIRIMTLEQGHGVRREDQIPIDYRLVFDYVAETKKLQLALYQDGSHIFMPKTHVTTEIHIGKSDGDQYRLLFRVAAVQQLQPVYANNPFGPEDILMPILFDLTFILEGGKIPQLSGSWYDLNNIVYRVIYANTESPQDRREIEQSIISGPGNFCSRVLMTPGKRSTLKNAASPAS